MAPGYSVATKVKRKREEILEDAIKRIQEGEFEGISHIVKSEVA